MLSQHTVLQDSAGVATNKERMQEDLPWVPVQTAFTLTKTVRQMYTRTGASETEKCLDFNCTWY